MIVARGLGRGAGRILVTAGLGLALAVTAPEIPPSSGGGFASFGVPSTWTQPTKPRQLELDLRLALAGHATSLTTLSGDLALRDVPQTSVPAAGEHPAEPTDRPGLPADSEPQRRTDPTAEPVTITGPTAPEQPVEIAPHRAAAHAAGSTELRADLALRLPVRLSATLYADTDATASLHWRAQPLQGAHSSRSDLRASLTIRHPEIAPLTAILAALDAVDAKPHAKRLDPMQAILAALDAVDATG